MKTEPTTLCAPAIAVNGPLAVTTGPRCRRRLRILGRLLLLALLLLYVATTLAGAAN